MGKEVLEIQPETDEEMYVYVFHRFLPIYSLGKKGELFLSRWVFKNNEEYCT